MKPARDLLKKILRNTEYEAMLLDHVSDGVVGADAAARITYWGKGAERMYGYSASEAIGKTALELLRPTYAAGERERIFGEIDRRGSAVATLRTKHKDGTEVVAEVNSTKLTDPEGRPAGYVVIYRDVTERTKTSQALQDANERLVAQAEEIQAKEAALRGILNAATESIWQFSPEGIVLMGNETALKRFGRTADEIIGRRFGEFVSPELALSRQAKLREAAESRQPVEFEDVRDGIAFHHSFYPVLDAEGNVSSIACFSRDITERRKVEDALIQARAEAEQRAGELEIVMDALRERGLELQHLTETLEVKVQERTAELAAANALLRKEAAERAVVEQHLRQVQKLEALGTLAGGIAHDFNNILNPIFISTELLLLDARLDPPSRHHLEVTLKAAERGRDLVKQIIAFSRQKEKERKPLEMGPVVREAVNFLRVSLPSTIEIRAAIGAGGDFILGDQAQVHQIVMNLCSNAAYAMREKGGVLTMSLAEAEVDAALASEWPGLRPGRYLRLVVADTGTGMSPEIRERAFDPFFTTKKPGEGSGMGLAVVDGIVRDYGGAIAVASEEGRGSTFTVFLPRVEAQDAPVEEAPETLPQGSARILLVDDEEVQVRSVRGMLQRLGYEVVAMTDPQHALDTFRDDPRAFDLMITDQTMPQLTGRKLAEEVLKIRPDLPIVLCTGFSEAVDAKEARTLGIREFLMKPYSVREMAVRVRQALGGSHGRPPDGRRP